MKAGRWHWVAPSTTAIIGADPADLTAACELLSRSKAHRVVVLEESQAIGGNRPHRCPQRSPHGPRRTSALHQGPRGQRLVGPNASPPRILLSTIMMEEENLNCEFFAANFTRRPLGGRLSPCRPTTHS